MSLKSKHIFIFLLFLFVICLFGLRPINAVTLNIIKPVNNSLIGSLSFPLNVSSNLINNINYSNEDFFLECLNKWWRKHSSIDPKYGVPDGFKGEQIRQGWLEVW